MRRTLLLILLFSLLAFAQQRHPTSIGSALPSQTGNSGKYLTTDGTKASWGTPAGSGTVTHTGNLNATANAVPTGSGAADLTASTVTISSGNVTVPAGSTVGSADTGTPKFTFGTNLITSNQPVTVAPATASPKVVVGSSNAAVTGQAGVSAITASRAQSRLIDLDDGSGSVYVAGSGNGVVFGGGAVTGLGSTILGAGATLTLQGGTSGSTVLSASATGGTLNLGSTNATVDSSGNAVFAGEVTAGGSTGILPNTAGVGSVGSATFPFANIFFAGTSGTPGTNNFKLTGACTSGTCTATFPDVSSATVAVAATSTTATQALFATSTAGAPAYRAIATADLPLTITFTSGTSRTLATHSEIIVCTSTCTVTPPASATAGDQFCVQNDDNVSTVITLAAVSGVQYEATARTSYGTANHTMTSGGAVKDQMCMWAVSATKWNVASSVGTWTNN